MFSFRTRCRKLRLLLVLCCRSIAVTFVFDVWNVVVRTVGSGHRVAFSTSGSLMAALQKIGIFQFFRTGEMTLSV